MRPVTLTVNGRTVSELVQPRTHLADFLRERLNLTGTHLRCEQGACGACTLLIDGQPARSCITYAAMCEGAEVRTIEGLRDDPLVLALQQAFSEEHALQCGYCTPGMLVTARDIVLRLPDATPDRIRLELSGNLCRCTGYVGIVHAIGRVLEERRRGRLTLPKAELAPAGPVGARAGGATSGDATLRLAAQPDEAAGAFADLGLNGRKPTLALDNTFTLERPADEVWSFFADPARVVGCLPGASITASHGGDAFDARMSIRLGPIAADFAGRAQISRDDAHRTGLIVGAGLDRGGGSRASGELRYAVRAENGRTLVDVDARILLVGPLAQFARAGIVEEIAAKLIERFAANVESSLSGAGPADGRQETLSAGSLLWSVLVARMKKMFGRR
jgi:carbon-monoxide dehydrogenase small subunit